MKKLIAIIAICGLCSTMVTAREKAPPPKMEQTFEQILILPQFTTLPAATALTQAFVLTTQHDIAYQVTMENALPVKTYRLETIQYQVDLGVSPQYNIGNRSGLPNKMKNAITKNAAGAGITAPRDKL